MSYPHYPAGTHPPTTATYPYGYHPTAYGHPQAAGAYPYQAPAGYQPTYSWTYPYSYMHQHPQAATAAVAQRPAQQATTATATTTTPATATTATTTSTIPQRTATQGTFSSYTPTYSRDTFSSSTSGNRGTRRQSNLRGVFSKDLKSLMYGFGDDRNPANDTVNVMEEILIEYISDVCQSAGTSSRKSRLSIEDLRRSLSRPADAKKLARMEELLFMQEDIKRARAQFEESDVHNPKEF